MPPLPLDQLLLDDRHDHRRCLGDLPPLHPVLRRAGKPAPAPGAGCRLVPHHMIRSVRQLHRGARLALGPTRLTPVFSRSDLGAGFASPSDEGGLLEFFEFCFTWAAKASTRASRSATFATCARKRAMITSFSASSSRSRALAARNPAITSGWVLAPGLKAFTFAAIAAEAGRVAIGRTPVLAGEACGISVS